MTGLPLDPDGDPPAREPAQREPAPRGHGRVALTSSLLVFAGGAVGTAVRYLLEDAFPVRHGGWPVTTFAINLGGALLLGFLLEMLARHGPDTGARHRLRLLAGTGFCGGFTTYSTLALETDRLAMAGQWVTAGAYPVISLACGAAAAAAGVRVAMVRVAMVRGATVGRTAVRRRG